MLMTMLCLRLLGGKLVVSGMSVSHIQTSTVHACFNILKSAIVPVGSTPVPDAGFLPMYRGIQVPLAWEFKYMGILLDHDFSFHCHFHRTLGQLNSAFFRHKSALAGLHLP